MLQLMRRGTTRERTEQLLDTIRKKVPGIAIRTTMITGHPNETESDFNELFEFVKHSRFDRLGVFTYSHEEQTKSFDFEDNVPEAVKQERADVIMSLQEEISYEKNQSMIGSEMKVLIDRIEGSRTIGRTEYDSPEVDNEVIIDTTETYLKVGDFANISIDDASAFDLYGRPTPKL